MYVVSDFKTVPTTHLKFMIALMVERQWIMTTARRERWARRWWRIKVA